MTNREFIVVGAELLKKKFIEIGYTIEKFSVDIACAIDNVTALEKRVAALEESEKDRVSEALNREYPIV